MGAHVLLMWTPPLKGWALLSQPPVWPEEEAERGQLHPLGPVLGQVSSGVGECRCTVTGKLRHGEVLQVKDADSWGLQLLSCGAWLNKVMWEGPVNPCSLKGQA